MQDMYANSNEESPPRLGLICFKTFHINSKKKIFHFKPITYICCSFDVWDT